MSNRSRQSSGLRPGWWVLVAPLVIAGMLSVPASCALAAGPHSMFMSPVAIGDPGFDQAQAIPSHVSTPVEPGSFHEHSEPKSVSDNQPLATIDLSDEGSRVKNVPHPWEAAAAASASVSTLPEIVVPRAAAPVSVTTQFPTGRIDRPGLQPPRI